MAKRGPKADASGGSVLTRDSVAFTPVAAAGQPQGRSVTASWHSPQCTTCGAAIDDIGLAMAQWRRDDRTGRNFSPVVNCKSGDGSTCASRFWEHTGSGWHPQDMGVTDFRRAPMDAVFVALRGRNDTDDERRLWAAWLSVVLGLPFKAGDSIVMLAAQGEVADQLIRRIPIVEIDQGDTSN